MDKISLNGEWTLKELGKDNIIPANVPGCNFIDLQNAGIIVNPHLSTNEEKVQWVGEKDWVYSKTFYLTQADCNHDYVEIVFKMLDTLCDIKLNGKLIAQTSNINREYIFDIKDNIKVGENQIELTFYSPLKTIKEKQKKNPMPNSTMGEPGSCHIRKSPYHFGWDWGPHLLCCGISRDAEIRLYNDCILTDLKIEQIHSNNNVLLNMYVENNAKSDENISYTFEIEFEGNIVARLNTVMKKAVIGIDNPNLWTCNGMGEQPLYTAKCTLFREDKAVDTVSKVIGLREIILDNSADEFGKNFCFKINGQRIFARGANWIASDSFINATSSEKLYDLLKKAKDCNMNMMRVWGGAYYESDEFYDICDRLGILVWQDCNFACSPYPFNDEEFVNNVLEEVKDNVRRLRHHACLCLWAGNNEIESMSMAWIYRKDIIKWTGEFFYNILPKRIREFDVQTPYVACTPSGGKYMKNVNSDNYYDTHLWHVWHGLRPLEYYRKRNTRFCSEFGIESFPSLNALDIFAKDDELTSINSPVMKAHQKCGGGNEKMLYYVLSKYWTPKDFKDLVYLSQLTQAQCVQNATEGWRIKKDRCNGSLYWQYNDCWGVCSWSGMDYYGNMKALQYTARHFNQPITVAIQGYKNKAEIFAVNDSANDAEIIVEYGIRGFSGEKLNEQKKKVILKKDTSINIDTIKYNSIGKNYKNCAYVFVNLYIGGELHSKRRLPLVAENKASFADPNLDYEITSFENRQVEIAIKADSYARYVELRLMGESNAFSDNYFDLDKDEVKTIKINLSEDISVAEFRQRFCFRSLFDIESKNSRLKDKMIKAKIFFMPYNFINFIARTFDV